MPTAANASERASTTSGAAPQPIHLDFRLGTKHLVPLLESLQKIGINQVALNLRFNQLTVEDTMKYLSEDVISAIAH